MILRLIDHTYKAMLLQVEKSPNLTRRQKSMLNDILGRAHTLAITPEAVHVFRVDIPREGLVRTTEGLAQTHADSVGCLYCNQVWNGNGNPNRVSYTFELGGVQTQALWCKHNAAVAMRGNALAAAWSREEEEEEEEPITIESLFG